MRLGRGLDIQVESHNVHTIISNSLNHSFIQSQLFIHHSQSSNGEWSCIHDILCITETRSRGHWCVCRMMKVAWQGTISSLTSVAESCLTLCNPMDFSMPGFPVHHQLSKFTQTHVHWLGDAIPTISSSVVPFSCCLQSFPASGFFSVS